MIQSSPDINLISPKTDLPQELVTIVGYLRRFGIGATILSLALGLFFGVGITVLRVRVAALSSEKTSLLTRIGNNSRKERLMTVVKKQSGVAQKVLASVKPWDALLAQIATVAPSPLFTSGSVNEKQELSLTVSAGTVADAAGVVERIHGFVKDKSIRNPFLNSLSMGAGGNVSMSITFVSFAVAK